MFWLELTLWTFVSNLPKLKRQSHQNNSIKSQNMLMIKIIHISSTKKDLVDQIEDNFKIVFEENSP